MSKQTFQCCLFSHEALADCGCPTQSPFSIAKCAFPSLASRDGAAERLFCWNYVCKSLVTPPPLAFQTMTTNTTPVVGHWAATVEQASAFFSMCWSSALICCNMSLLLHCFVPGHADVLQGASVTFAAPPFRTAVAQQFAGQLSQRWAPPKALNCGDDRDCAMTCRSSVEPRLGVSWLRRT